MILPSLISVSVAPVSYFFWASALPVVAAKAMIAVENAVTISLLLERMFSPLFLVSWLLTSLEFAEQLLSNHGDLPCAVRHQEDDEEQQNAEYSAGKTLRDPFRDIRNEDDERRAHDRSWQPTHAADDHAEKQRNRERDGVAVRCDELHGDGSEAPGDAGDAGADPERQRLVQCDVDAHRGCRDFVVADRHEGAAGA